MESTKFECQLAPVGDPNMKVEWFLNGKPLRHSMCKQFNVLIIGCIYLCIIILQKIDLIQSMILDMLQ